LLIAHQIVKVSATAEGNIQNYQEIRKMNHTSY